MSDIEPIRWSSQIRKIQTMVDGGYSMTLHIIPPTTLDDIMKLMQANNPGIVLECAAIAVDVETLTKLDDKDKKGDETTENAEGSNPNMDRRRRANRRDQRAGG